MHIHILGICGTFMGSLALLAKEAGHRVSGCDANVYPPMSTQLACAGIELIEGFDPCQLEPPPDLVVVGNAMSRGNPCVEYMLAQGLRYTSGPQWLGDHLLQDKWVLAVAGTHGKTTTSAMLAWILESADMAPGFLIGGVPGNFPTSARLGGTPFFVVEADEYDTAFFDKRSKFLHYHPRTLILNNLEFDHADIFPDLAAIQTQFHHLVRTVPSNGLIIYPEGDEPLKAVLERGSWTPLETIGQRGWRAERLREDGSHFIVYHGGNVCGEVRWEHSGDHNVHNALAAIAAARNVGAPPSLACEALCRFAGVKRRMELLDTIGGVRVYDDFAHHPTAIATTLEGLRKKVGSERIVAVLEPRSNTMRMGVHHQGLAKATAAADHVLWFEPNNMSSPLSAAVLDDRGRNEVVDDIRQLVERTALAAGESAHVVVMSNGGFLGFHGKLLEVLRERL